MPLINVIRKGITPAVRKVPTSTCAVMMPMTLERVDKEAASESEEPVKVEDVPDAFKKFQPTLSFKGTAGPEETEFKSEFRFRTIKDFEPDNLLKRHEIKNAEGETEYLRNDLADMKNNIDLLYRLKDRWKLPRIRRAWGNEQQRNEILQALGRLRAELERVAQKGGSQ